MKKWFLILASATIGAAGTFAQSNTATATAVNVRDNAGGNSATFYFPVTLLNDPDALNKAIPLMAQQVAAVYNEGDKIVFYEHAFRYQLLAGRYKKAIALLDSLQALQENKALGIQFKSYAHAKLQEETKAASFEKAYTTTFAGLFNSLSFRDEVQVADYFSPATATRVSTSLQQITDKLKKDGADSISLRDAQTLLRWYSSRLVYDKVTPLSTPFITDDLKTMYPVIKSGRWAGVVPVEGVDEVPDPKMQYNLLMEITTGIKNDKDTAAIRSTNNGLETTARLLNLHAASGIPAKNINTVAVLHGYALTALLKNDVYKKKFQTGNPNLKLLKELQDAGVKIIVCGQTMHYTQVKKEDLISGVNVSLTAQTALSAYQLKNYVIYDLSGGDQ